MERGQNRKKGENVNKRGRGGGTRARTHTHTHTHTHTRGCLDKGVTLPKVSELECGQRTSGGRGSGVWGDDLLYAQLDAFPSIVFVDMPGL